MNTRAMSAYARLAARYGGMVHEIKALHAPVERYGDLECGGCNFGGWEGEPPRWPCATAQIVFTEEYIAECQQAMDLQQKWRWENAPRFSKSKGLWLDPNPWSLMADAFIADKIFPRVPVTKAADLVYEYRKGDWNTNPIALRPQGELDDDRHGHRPPGPSDPGS